MRTIGAFLLLASAALAEDRCTRIVSLAPSISETIFALGLGSQLVGVSRFCTLPAEASNLPRMGGFVDPNFEAIAAAQPSAVFFLTEFRQRAEELQSLGIPTYPLDQRTVSGILESIGILGKICKSEERARALQKELRQEAEEIRVRVEGTPRVRTLVVVGSESIDSLRSLYLSGQDGFYDELLTMAGGQNVVKGQTRSAQALALEGIVALNPEVIIAIHPNFPNEAEGATKALAAWSEFPMISAVRNRRVYVLSSPEMYIPGPRYPRLLERLARILHPEVF